MAGEWDRAWRGKECAGACAWDGWAPVMGRPCTLCGSVTAWRGLWAQKGWRGVPAAGGGGVSAHRGISTAKHKSLSTSGGWEVGGRGLAPAEVLCSLCLQEEKEASRR